MLNTNNHHRIVVKIFMTLIILILSHQNNLYSQQKNNAVKYSQMSSEETRRIIEDVAKNLDFGGPLNKMEFNLPSGELNAQGIKINDTDWVIFSLVKSSTVTYLYLQNEKWKNNDFENKATGYVKFVTQGLLASSVDLKLTNYQFCDDKNILKKGAYIFEIGNPGLGSFYNDDDIRYFLFLKDPLEDMPENATELIHKEGQTIFQIELSTLSGDRAGILMQVPGEDIIFIANSSTSSNTSLQKQVVKDTFGHSFNVILAKSGSSYATDGYTSYEKSKSQWVSSGAVLVVGLKDGASFGGKNFKYGDIIVVYESNNHSAFRLAKPDDLIMLNSKIKIFGIEYKAGIFKVPISGNLISE